MKIDQLTQQVRAGMVAGMGSNLVLAYIEKEYPDLSPDVKSQLLERLAAKDIPGKGDPDATRVEKGPQKFAATPGVIDFEMSASRFPDPGPEPKDEPKDISTKGDDAT